MKKLCSLIGILFLYSYSIQAQNIFGVVNDYAAVKNIAGTGISVSSTTGFSYGDKILLIQMKGAVIDSSNTSNFGNITDMGGAGNYEFLNVSTVIGTVITVAPAPTKTYNVATGFVQVVRIPKFCTPVVTSPVTCPAWDETVGYGGIVAFEAGTLTLNSSINASEKGFAGGNYALGSFGCADGHYYGVQGIAGGQKGESISAYMAYHDGLKGKQANGGGGSNTGNSGGGGGGNGGSGGIGGDEYSGCSAYDDRGVGGLGVSTGLTTMFFGGGGGGGYEDNGQVATMGGRGGGIIYIKANAIVSNNQVISSKGENVVIIANDEGSGGGGAGGTIFIECTNITGTLQVNASGGFGGSNKNILFPADAHGPGGGGGGGVFAYAGASLPPGTTYSSPGGAAGTINNPSSSYYGTTFGAAAGTTGVSYPNLPVTAGLVVPTLTTTPSGVICPKQTLTLTAGGTTSYSWSTGATTSTIAVSPTVNTSYTVTGTAGNSCKASVVISLTVSTCAGIPGIDADQALKIYPNPTSGKLFIETDQWTAIHIIDNLGKTILQKEYEQGSYSIDLSAYPAGVYFVKVSDKTMNKTIKLVKTE